MHIYKVSWLLSIVPLITLAAADSTLAPVSVVGMSGAEQIRYRDLMDGVAAFDEEKLNYSPDASLEFVIHDRSKSSHLPLRLVLETKEEYLDVPVNQAQQLVLPSPDKVGKYDGSLMANRPKGDVTIIARVHSPNDSDSQVRLGDLRLECKVNWAIQKHSVSLGLRTTLFFFGRMCHTDRIGIDQDSDRALDSVTLKSGDRELRGEVRSNGLNYHIPLWDESWGNDSEVLFNYI